MTARFEENIDRWIETISSSPKNLASDIELREQAKVALNLFLGADIDGSESLSFDELKVLCDQMGLPMNEDDEDNLVKMDTDGSGFLSLDEWVLWWLGRVSSLPNPLKQQEAIARNTFDKFDIDKSGALDARELRELISALGADFTDEELNQALAEIDEDNSGLIEASEFVLWWTDRAANNRRNSSLVSMKLRKLAAKSALVFKTDIFTAAWNGDVDLVKSFLDSEKRTALSTDESDNGGGWTALHYACYQGHERVVDLLLQAGASVNKTNNEGFTALFYAAQRGHIEICRQLVAAGADPTIVGTGSLHFSGDVCKTVFMCAVDHAEEYPELVSIFEKSDKAAGKCVPPSKLSLKDFKCNVDRNGILTVDISLTSQQISKTLSALPVRYWSVTLRRTNASSGATTDLTVKLPANPPSAAQSNLTVDVSRQSWYLQLMSEHALLNMTESRLPSGDLSTLPELWSALLFWSKRVVECGGRVSSLESTLLNCIGSSNEVAGETMKSAVAESLKALKAASSSGGGAGAAAESKGPRGAASKTGNSGSGSSGSVTVEQLEKYVGQIHQNYLQQQRDSKGESSSGGAVGYTAADVARAVAGKMSLVSVRVAAVNSLAPGEPSDFSLINIAYPTRNR